jgi:hypothetical protein
LFRQAPEDSEPLERIDLFRQAPEDSEPLEERASWIVTICPITRDQYIVSINDMCNRHRSKRESKPRSYGSHQYEE